LPVVDMSREARRQFLSLPPDTADQFKELSDYLKLNPHRLPPWRQVKSIGRERGEEAFSARVGEFRATYVSDGEVIRFTRFRLRRHVEYGALPTS
jgi:mRNA-degrading endonuclease RelE of RelBE toxin-antitoxin system